METEKEIVNRVASSALITFDLEQYHQPGERVVVDIKEQLYQELILKEKDFRDYIKKNDWSQYKNKFVAITCSADAIIPTWAYMLLTSVLQPFARTIVFGTLEELETKIFFETLSKVEWQQFANAKIVIKGCSKVDVPAAVYVEATRLIMPFAASIMFGEPCSTVPVYKKPK
jgi:predicted polyphosphate/ATP-dependent NAD kinase